MFDSILPIEPIWLVMDIHLQLEEELKLQAVLALKPLIVGQCLNSIRNNWATFWRRLTCDSQLRWIGPEKGALHMATGAIVNAIWDAIAKIECKPLWKLLVDMEPEQLVDVIDFHYITDALTKDEALEMLRQNRKFRSERETVLRESGFPAYTTGVGWVGYDEEKRRKLCREALAAGYKRFKAKVGTTIEEDRKRLQIIREEIGNECLLMVDANQKWEVNEAIETMSKLTQFNLLWIEEPTSPDDILGHAAISRALAPHGIGVATGEQCQNRIIFKQLLSSRAIQFCQIDSCRVGGVNELLSIMLMAHKFSIPVCPHAGGVGLCEYVQHLSMWDYVALGGSFENRMIEFIPHLSEHFHFPAKCEQGRYLVPEQPGYSAQMKDSSIEEYEFPNGPYWTKRASDSKQ
ncbi:hypothetical protein RDWZM_008766 [Blomia tropicalis]|uniref:Mitochondrial enolase superfamily member 1 n=1 Tax=Blomia tropicalis TaxID=40697 RepID=A0A9Q0M2B0_BLOTA|nr:hypothetical protein RDWZM_008766 [Blomia tropicalis]